MISFPIRVFLMKEAYKDLVEKGDLMANFQLKELDDEEKDYKNFFRFYAEFIIQIADDQNLINFDAKKEATKGIVAIDKDYLKEKKLEPATPQDPIGYNENFIKIIIKPVEKEVIP